MGGRHKKSRSPVNRDPRQAEGEHASKADLHAAAARGRGNRGSPSPSRIRRYRVFAVCGLLLLAVGLVFGQTLHHDFVNFDDGQYVYENPHVTGGLTAKGLAWACTTSHASLWGPLTWVSYMVDYELYGLKPWGYHLTNVLLHAACALVLFLVLWRMTGDFWPSALVAGLFAIHPLRAESVAWVAERKGLLAGLFFLLAIGSYVEYVRRPFSLARYLAVTALLLLSLTSKPIAVTFPFLALLLDYWPLRRALEQGPARDEKAADSRPGRWRSVWPLVAEKIPWIVLSAAACAIAPLTQGTAVMSLDKLTISSRIANALVAYVAYLGQFFCPVGLAAFYPLPEGGQPWWKVAGAAAVLIAISAAVLACRRKCPCLLVGWLWYLGTMVPTIGLVQLGGHAMADRYTYLPQIGMCVAIVWGFAQVAAVWPRTRWAMGAAASLALACLMGVASVQASYWKNGESLWKRTLACTSQNPRAHFNLGVALDERHRLDEAIVQYQEAVKLEPRFADAHNNLGAALAARGRIEEAIAQYRLAIENRPDFAGAHNNLGVALTGRGDVPLAIEQYRKALEAKPDFAEAYDNLAGALLARGHVEEAIADYREALRINPNYAQAHYHLGVALTGQGQTAEAIAHYHRALESKPDYADAHNNLGNAMFDRKQIMDAIKHYEKALQIDSRHTAAHNNLGFALAALGKVDEAIGHYRKALEVTPDYADAHFNLANALASRQRFDEAIAHFREALRIKPGFSEVHNNLGNALKSRGRLDEAVLHYRKALNARPDNGEAQFNLGAALAQQGNAAEAVAHCREAIRLLPDHVVMLNGLALMLATHPDAAIRNGTEAVELARRAARFSGDRDPAVLDTLAAAYAEAGQFADARQSANRALSLASAQGNAALADAIRAKLKLYEANTPYRAR